MLVNTDELNKLKSQEVTEEKDVSREGLTGAKLVHFAKVLFSQKATTVLETHNKFSDIDFETWKFLGKKAMILDVDDCIAPHHGEILPENLELIKELLQDKEQVGKNGKMDIEAGWKIVIFSNMKKSDRYKQLEDLGVEVITSKYAKPDFRGFDECVEAMTEFFEEKNTGRKFNRGTFDPMDYDCAEEECDLFENFSKKERIKIIKKQIIMVGDNYLTDGGAIGAGIDFIKIDPIEVEENGQSIARRLQKMFRGLVDTIVEIRGNSNKNIHQRKEPEQEKGSFISFEEAYESDN